MAGSMFADGVRKFIAGDAETVRELIKQAEDLEKGELLTLLKETVEGFREHQERLAVRLATGEEIDRYIEKHGNIFRGCAG